MKNLSLQMTDLAALKKPEAGSKSNVGNSNAESAAPHSAFQKLLNKQAQTKQNQVQEHLAKQNKLNKTEANAAQVKQVDAGNKAKNTEFTEIDNAQIQQANHLQFVITATNHTKAIADKARLESRQQIAKAQTDLDSRRLIDTSAKLELSLDLSTKPVASGDATNQEARASDVTDANLAVANVLALPLPTVALDNKVSSSASYEHAAEAYTSAVGSDNSKAEKQSTVSTEICDKAFSHALTQGKNTSSADDKQANSQRLDAMLPNATKGPTSEDTSAKLVMNANKDNVIKDGMIKDVAIKDSAIKPSAVSEQAMAVNLQLQSKVSETTQPLASSNVINAYPGKTGWDQAISQKIVWMVGAQEQSATLTLNPPDMGPLQVVIHVHNDQADTTFISDNAEVRQALQDGMANLRDKLNESGIQLGQANVNSGGQMQQQFQQSGQQNAARAAAANNSQTTQSHNLSVAHPAVRVANGLVDTFV